MSHVKILGKFDRTEELSADLFRLIDRISPLPNKLQISITGVSDDHEWDCSIKNKIKFNQRYFSVLHKSLKGTIFDELVQQYPAYYRWRLLCIPGNHTYTVHDDGPGNRRIHFPIVTNKDCFLCFYDSMPDHKKQNTVDHYHLETGTIYEIDSSGYHTAVNYGDEDRWHLIGVRGPLIK